MRDGKKTRFQLALVLFLLSGLATVHAAPGDTQWVFETGGAVNSSPAIGTGGTVYVGSADGKVYALDGRTGDKKWDFLTGGAVDSDPAIGIEGTVYVGSADGKLYALDGLTGSEKWEADIPKPFYGNGIHSPAVGADGTLYVAGSNGLFRALAGADGSLKWEAPSASSVVTSAAIGADGTLYVVRGDWSNPSGSWVNTKLCALDGATGSQKWTIPLNLGPPLTPAIGADGTIYAGSSITMYALDGATGNKRWESPIGEYATVLSSSSGSPVVNVDGTIYVSGGYAQLDRLNGKVYALEGVAGLARSSWPRFGGGARNTCSRQHLGPPILMAQPTNQLVGVSFPFSLEAVAEGAQPLSYAWLFNGAPLMGMTNSVLSFAFFNETNEGSYRVRVTNALGSVESSDIGLAAGAQIAVEVVGPGKVQRTPAVSLMPCGTAVELTAQPDAGRPFLGWSGDLEDTNLVWHWTAGHSVRLRATFAYLPGELKWTFQPPGNRTFATAESGSPAMATDGTLYVCSDTVRFRRVYALDGKTGVVKWVARPSGEWFTSSMVGIDGTVYVNSSVGGLAALDGVTGKTKWTFPDNAGLAIAADGTVDVSAWIASPTDIGKVYALDGASGTGKWEFAAQAASLTIGADGTLYMGRENLYALNPNSGHTNWVSSADGIGVAPAIGSDGTLFLPSRDNKLLALDPRDGSTKWESPLDGAGQSSPVLGTDGTVYVGTDGSRLYAFDGLTGYKKWEFSAGGSIYISPAVGADGTVYVSCAPNKLYAVDGLTGLKKWEFQTGDMLASAPTIGADGTIYVPQHGAIYALQGEGGLAKSSWPKSRGNAQNTGNVLPFDPTPVRPRLLNVEGGASGVILIRWETTPGARYQLQSTARLELPAWANAGNIVTATGQTVSQSETIGTNTQRYYRVLRLGD